MYKSLLIQMIKQIQIRRRMLITSSIIGLFFAFIFVIFRSANNSPETPYKNNVSSRAPASFEYVVENENANLPMGFHNNIEIEDAS